jgi:dTDP-4-dehydrorhamnose 3,5-epimerase
MQVTRLDIDGLFVFEPRAFEDERGAFFESFNLGRFREATGLDVDFVQDNHSVSHKNVLRGLHYQVDPHAQGKLVRVVRGAAWDVAVDIRAGSPSFGKWAAVELNALNRKQFWIPAGFAHGFLALEDETEMLYKVTTEWNAASERTLRWDDETVSIGWPVRDHLILSAKDQGGVKLADAGLLRHGGPT